MNYYNNTYIYIYIYVLINNNSTNHTIIFCSIPFSPLQLSPPPLQELSKVLPDAVRNHGDLTLPSGHLINDFQVINKDRIFMENIGAVKQLCKVTDRLENRIYELESLNRMLTKMNTGLLRSSIKSSISMNSLSMPPPLMGYVLFTPTPHSTPRTDTKPESS